ncbi:hypothetical protein AB0B15_12265 [Streptomyces sp. NPDC045456]|uniref:hypothetical protein n=1 Tax=Streptomyces sp. NPDC045456 TaxID=3155254 RepID=UPI003408EAA2
MTKAIRQVVLGAVSTAAVLAAASPAVAGGIGVLLSPALGNACAQHGVGAHARGHAGAGTGTAGGNALGLPVTGPLSQCGGADLLPSSTDITKDKPALIQDVAESIAVEEVARDVQVGLVNVQDLVNSNEIPVNALSQNDILRG